MLQQQPQRGDDALPRLRDSRRARAMAVAVASNASTRGGLRPSIVAARRGASRAAILEIRVALEEQLEANHSRLS